MRGGYRGRGRAGNGRGFHQAQCDELEVPEEEWKVHYVDIKASHEVEGMMSPTLRPCDMHVESGVVGNGTVEIGDQESEVPTPFAPGLSSRKVPVLICVAI